MKHNECAAEVPPILRHFRGQKGNYGQGDCHFWQHKVSVDTLKYSSSELKKLKFSEKNVSLSDVVDWSRLKINSFGTKPKEDIFKVKFSWHKFLILIIEVAYAILGLDPDKHCNGSQNQKTKDPTIRHPYNEPNDSSDDFESLVGESKNNDPVLRKVLSDSSEVIPEGSLFQVIALYQVEGDGGLYTAHLSDGDSWVPAKLDKVKIWTFIMKFLFF